MNKAPNPSPRKTGIQGRPDYYITPTRDFTQYTKDSEEKYWNRDTKFDWQQNVRDNLKTHLENLDPEAFSKALFMVLPIIEGVLARKIAQVRQEQFPLEEDALNDIAECIPFDRPAIQQALLLLAPLNDLQSAVRQLKDQLEMLNSAFWDLQEQQRLGFFQNGVAIKPLETAAEKQEQALELSRLANRIEQVQQELDRRQAEHQLETAQLKTKARKDIAPTEAQILTDLEETRALIQQTLQARSLPRDPLALPRLKDLMLKRQLRGLKDIANHALVVEQSAIAPLTMGIIHYKRHREIQEAMTTFIHDEAKHSATFRRYLVEKLAAREFVSAKLIQGASRYMWLARFMPGTGMFLAVLVEAIGAAYLEFFGREEYMPEPLFFKISKTISEQDEKRHMDLCVAIYNEIYRTGRRWERVRNHAALKVILRSVYGDKTEDHHLIQAFRAFGVESDTLYRHIVGRLSQQLARVGMYVEPERLLEFIGVGAK